MLTVTLPQQPLLYVRVSDVVKVAVLPVPLSAADSLSASAAESPSPSPSSAGGGSAPVRAATVFSRASFSLSTDLYALTTSVAG